MYQQAQPAKKSGRRGWLTPSYPIRLFFYGSFDQYVNLWMSQ